MILKYTTFEDMFDYTHTRIIAEREELLCRFVNANHIEQKDILSVYDTTHGKIVLIYWSKEEEK